MFLVFACGGHIFIGQADYPGQRLPEPTRSNIPCICTPPRGVIQPEIR
jgi:hypothetical protein